MKPFSRICLLLFAGVLLLVSPARTVGDNETGSGAPSNRKSVKKLHEIAIGAFEEGREEPGRRAVETVIERFNTLPEDGRLSDFKGYREDLNRQTIELTTVLVQQEKRHELARRYTRALLVKKNLYPRFIYDDDSRTAIRKAYSDHPEVLYRIVRTFSHVSHHRKLIDEDGVLDVIRTRMKEDRLDSADIRFIARKTAEHDAWRDDDASKDALKTYRNVIERGVERNPNNPRFRWRLGDVYFLMTEYEKAAGAYRRVMDTAFGKKKNKRFDNGLVSADLRSIDEPYRLRDNSPPFMKLAVSLGRMGRTGEAQGGLMRQLEKHPNDIRTRIMVAIGLIRIGKPEKAVSLLRERYGALKRELAREEKKHYRALWWTSLQLMKQLRRMNRSLEAMFVGEQTVQVADTLDLPLFRKRKLKALKKHLEELRHRGETSEITKEFLNVSRPDPSEAKTKTIERLVDQLGARSYSKRNRAFQKLNEMGASTVPVLRTHRDHDNREIRRKVRQLINRFARQYKVDDLRKKYGLKSEDE